MSEPVQITVDDSYPIIFAAYPGQTPIIDGGVQINDFAKTTVNGRTAWVADLPQVRSGQWSFRQLFVDGIRAQRARLPKTGWYVVADPLADEDDLAARKPQDRFMCKACDIQASWRNLQDIDILMLSYWAEDRLPIKSFDPKTNIVTTRAQSSFSMIEAHPFHGAGNARYWLENVFEALTEPGEWYLDQPAGKLYYIPIRGQQPETTRIYAPFCKQFFNIAGSSKDNDYVQNIRFKGITFRHAAYTWNKYRGTGNNYENSEPGVVRLSYAQYCSIEDCIFEHIGPYALDLDTGCTRIRVVGNTFTDLGAGAIKMISVPHTASDAGVTGVNLISDNEMVQGGRAFPGSPAIVASRVAATIIAHNHIADFYYNGITLGGGGYWEHASRENHIVNNHIHNIGQKWLSDMGGIYIHGIQPGTTIAGNLIHDIEKAAYGGQCLYLDAGASHIVVENNLCYRTNGDILNMKGRENIIRNNIFAYGQEGLVRCAVGTDGGRYVANIFHNILLSDGAAMYRGGYTMDLRRLDWLCDANLLWNSKASRLFCVQEVPVKSIDVVSWDEWQKQIGQDRNSIITDPGFVDPQHDDFTLPENSPAYAMGFIPVQFDTAGPRPKALRNQPISTSPESKVFKGHVD